MTAPVVTSMAPRAGSAGGGDLVRLVGAGFADAIDVFFGDAPARVIVVRTELGISLADVRTSAHAPGAVDVVVRNVSATGDPIPREEIRLARAFRFERAHLAEESGLTRVIRALLQTIKSQVLLNATTAVAVDYCEDDLLVPVAALPSIVLTGPRIRESRIRSSNAPSERVVAGPFGPEMERTRAPYTADLSFGIVAQTNQTTQILNLAAELISFFRRNPYLSVPRDPRAPAAGDIRLPMVPEGEGTTLLEGEDDLRVFQWRVGLRGFDFDDARPLDRGRGVGFASASRKKWTDDE